MQFDAHMRAFTALGGIPRRGIYDNMKTAVDRVKKGKSRIVNTRFAAMASHYLFDPDFCNVASGWEKGVVEKNVQDSRRRIWQEATEERFGSFAELNLWLLAKCRSLWGELKHPEFDLTLAEMLEQEQPSLMPMITPFDGYVETLGKVASTCLVIEERNRYSVPCELVGQMVSIRTYPERIDFVAHDAAVASHSRCFGRKETRYDWQHYIPIIERKPGALRNGAPFAAPTGGCSRCCGAGAGVWQLQRRAYRECAEPAQAIAEVETHLEVNEAPIADTVRYDGLRLGVEVHHA